MATSSHIERAQYKEQAGVRAADEEVICGPLRITTTSAINGAVSVLCALTFIIAHK
jgi:hypothetical protein